MWFIVSKIVQGELGIYLTRLKRLATIYVVMGVVAVMLFAFLITALFVYASTYYGPLTTALAASAGCVVVLLVLWIASILIKRNPDKQAHDRMKRDIASVAGVTALSKAPVIIRTIGRKKSLLVIPAAGALSYGLWRTIVAMRDR